MKGIYTMKRSGQLSIGIIGLFIFVLAGCAPTEVKVLTESVAQFPKPDRILVYRFAVSPDEITLDRGISSQIERFINKTPRTAEEKAVGRRVADIVAKHLVQNIETLGLKAEMAEGEPPKTGNIFEINGQFISVDEGNSAERVIVGFGAGRTEVKTYVQAYDVSGGSRLLAGEFEVDAKSGAAPITAKFDADVESDGKRTAERIVKEALEPFFVSQKWIPKKR
jgi:hypothetical protein